MRCDCCGEDIRSGDEILQISAMSIVLCAECVSELTETWYEDDGSDDAYEEWKEANGFGKEI